MAAVSAAPAAEAEERARPDRQGPPAGLDGDRGAAEDPQGSTEAQASAPVGTVDDGLMASAFECLS